MAISEELLKELRLSSTEEQKQVFEFLTALYTSRPADGTDQQTAISRLQREMAGLPVANPDDGVRARDHDRVLYGERR
jgi:hypothetical protein